MTTLPLWLQNLAALSLQVTLVTAAAAALAWAIRVGLPAARLAYWQLVLFICLVLPAAQPWRPLEPIASPRVAESRELTAQSLQTRQAPTSTRVPSLGEVTLLVLAGGAALRFLWLLAGFVSLRRLRRTSRTLDPLPAPLARAQQSLGVRADFRVSDRVQGPVTFGIRRPLILLPSRVLEMPGSSQEAIACHELIHVRRRDWAWTAVEEVVLAIFWFHPAIWWLAGRIRLAREQVVDREAVAVTESGQRYVEALLAVAGFDRETLLTPVTLFFEARHLVQRVTSVLKESPTKESNMSKKRLILRVVLGLCAALSVARLSVSLFPLHALVRDQVVAQEGPVQVESSMTLLHGSRIAYPEAARKQRIEGEVVASITLDEQGQVTDARIVSGPEQFRKAVLSSLLTWHYNPSKLGRREATVTVRFRLPAEGSGSTDAETRETKERLEQTLSRKIYEAAKARTASELEGMLKQRVEELELLRSGQAGQTAEREERLKRQIEELKSALADMHGVSGGVRGGVEGGVLGGITYEGLSDATRETVQGRLPVRVGDPFNETTLYQLRDVLVGIDRHLLLRAKRDREGKYWLIVGIQQ